MSIVARSRPAVIPAGGIPTHRTIETTPNSIVSQITLASGGVRTTEFWVADGVLWHRSTTGPTTRYNVIGPLLRKLLNDNNI